MPPTFDPSYVITSVLINDPPTESFLKYLTRVILYPYVTPPILLSILTNYQQNHVQFNPSHNIDSPFDSYSHNIFISPEIHPVDEDLTHIMLTTKRITVTFTPSIQLCISMQYDNHAVISHTIPPPVIMYLDYLFTHLPSSGQIPPPLLNGRYTPRETLARFESLLSRTFRLLHSTSSTPVNIHAPLAYDATLHQHSDSYEATLKHAMITQISTLPQLLNRYTEYSWLNNLPAICATLNIHAFTYGICPKTDRDAYYVFFTANYIISSMALPSVKRIARSSLILDQPLPPHSWATLPPEIDDQIFTTMISNLFSQNCQYTHPIYRTSDSHSDLYTDVYPLQQSISWKNRTTVSLLITAAISCGKSEKLAISSSRIRDADKLPRIHARVQSAKHLIGLQKVNQLPVSFPSQVLSADRHARSHISAVYCSIAQSLNQFPECKHPSPLEEDNYPVTRRNQRQHHLQAMSSLPNILSDLHI